MEIMCKNKEVFDNESHVKGSLLDITNVKCSKQNTVSKYALRLHTINNALGKKISLDQAILAARRREMRALSSYANNDVEKRHCPLCGLILKYNSLDYDQCRHISDCYY